MEQGGAKEKRRGQGLGALVRVGIWISVLRLLGAPEMALASAEQPPVVLMLRDSRGYQDEWDRALSPRAHLTSSMSYRKSTSNGSVPSDSSPRKPSAVEGGEEVDSIFQQTALYLEGGQFSDAQRTLALVDPEKLPEEKRPSFQELRTRIESARTGVYADGSMAGTIKKPYWASVGTTTGFDSNIFASPSNKEPEGEATMQTYWSGGYHFQKGEKRSVKVSYGGSWSETAQHPDFKMISHWLQGDFEARTPFAGFSDDRKIEFHLVPYAQHDTWINIPYQAQAGARLSFKHTLDRNLEWSGQIQATKLMPLMSGMEYSAGTSSRARVSAKYRVDKIQWRALLALASEQVGDYRESNGNVMPLAYKGVYPELEATWTANDKLSTTLTAGTNFKFYDSAIQPTGAKRFDRYQNIAARVDYTINSDVSSSFSCSYSKNDSTLGPSEPYDKNWSGWGTQASVNWSAF